MGHVYITIANRLKRFSINLDQYIMPGTLEEGSTTIDGIKFVAQNLPMGPVKPTVGIDDLKKAFDQARNGDNRAFAGQIREEDRDHALLQASFGNTDGLGFREIFYLSQRPTPSRDPQTANVWDADGRAFDAKFGAMADKVDITSLHAALLGPINPSALPGGVPATVGHKGSNQMNAKSSIHLDDQGFVYADSGGRIFLSSNVIQHMGDELAIKDKLLGGGSPLSFFFHTDLNSISDPTLGTLDMRNNNFLRSRSAQGVMGLELSAEAIGLQVFARGSLGLEADGLRRPKVSEVAGVLGLRKRF